MLSFAVAFDSISTRSHIYAYINRNEKRQCVCIFFESGERFEWNVFLANLCIKPSKSFAIRSVLIGKGKRPKRRKKMKKELWKKMSGCQQPTTTTTTKFNKLSRLSECVRLTVSISLPFHAKTRTQTPIDNESLFISFELFFSFFFFSFSMWSGEGARALTRLFAQECAMLCRFKPVQFLW